MTTLTRRRSNDRHDCWHVYYGDVRVGTIAKRVGIPPGQPPWGWNCGFYPGSEPEEHATGIAETLNQARAAFEKAWAVFLSKRTEADYEAWRHEGDWTARKYAMWKNGERPPSQKPSTLMTCPCGQVFDSHRLEETVIHVPHITASVMVH
jgi:hypothetical protein